jgi:hypothetical protein
MLKLDCSALFRQVTKLRDTGHLETGEGDHRRELNLSDWYTGNMS